MSNLKGETVMVNKGLQLLARASHSSTAVTLELLASFIASLPTLLSPDIMKQR